MHARQLLKVQAGGGGLYNASSSKLMSEVMKEHSQQQGDQLIIELGLDRIFGFKPETRFEGGPALGPRQR